MNTANTSNVYGAYGSEFGQDCSLSSSGNDLIFNPPNTFNYTWHDSEGNVIEGETSNIFTAIESGEYSIVATSKPDVKVNATVISALISDLEKKTCNGR